MQINQKWIIELSDTQLAQLSEDERNLGDLMSSEENKHYLIFRDSFVALKVANTIGAERNAAKIMPASDATNPIAQFADGNALVAEYA